MLTKSRGAIAACALAIAAVGGSVAVIRAASSGPTVAASAALPSPVGTATTATVPSSTGAGSALNGNGSADGGSSNAGSGGTGTAGGQHRSPAAAAAAVLSRSAGQGRPGPLPAGSLPADGAVPGASPALRALAAARAATTALPHSPRLLAELAGTTPSASASATASASGTPDTGNGSATPTARATDTTAAGSPAAEAARAAGAAAAATAGTPTPSAGTAASGTTSVPGLDVAGYQHQNGDAISWSRVAAAGYKFAAVKGTEGDYYVNPWAATDLAQAKAAGFDVSPYHFAIPNASTGTQQAQYAVEYSGYAAGGRMLPLTLDIEYDPYVSTDHSNECYGLTAGQMTTWIAGFVSQTRSLTGQYPIIYTTADWWDTCTGGSTAFGADPMWVAAYGFIRPPMPAGWSTWTLWQYTSSGTVPGVDSPGTTDLDIFSPGVVGLINPGDQASRLHAKVSVAVGSLGALAHEALTYSAAGLPPGLTIGANGVITGTDTSTIGTLLPKVYRVTLSAKNAMGARSTVAFSWQVSPACQHSLANGVCPAG